MAAARDISPSDAQRRGRSDRRAEQLLRDAAGDEVVAMYRDLGFIGVLPPTGVEGEAALASAQEGEEPGYGYLIFPQRPIVAYDTATGELLNEYCVRFEDHSDLDAGPELPDADDVLAKWLALVADERGLIEMANMDRPGRQLDPGQVKRNLASLALWKARRSGASLSAPLPVRRQGEVAL